MRTLSFPGTLARRLSVTLLVLLCSLTFSSRAHAQTFNQIQFVIGTGDDDLRGDSSATATLQGPGGATLQTITLKSQSQPGWNNNTSHTVTVALTPPLAQSAIGHIVLRLTSHNSFTETDDNWNVQSVVVRLSNSGSGAVEIVNVSGDPFVRLTGSQPTVTVTPLPVGPAGTFNEIEFIILTGGDDLRGDSSATAKLLNSSGATMQTITLKSQSQPGWNNNSTHSVSAPLSSPVKLFEISDIVITLTSHNSFPETDDNWNVQDVVVNLSNNGAGAKRILHAFGNPMVRLTGSIPSTSFPLPPLLFGPVCRAGAAGCIDVTTYHNDSMRTGWNSNEKVLNASNVNSTRFGRIATLAVDDQVDTQPLVVDGVTYIATENNTLYAVDFWNGSSVVHHFGSPVPTPLGCGNNGPNVGINGTPVIDLPSRTLYADTYLLDGDTFAHEIHAVDIGSLQERPHSPVTVAATHTLEGGGSFSFDAKDQRQRPGLLLANGNVYAGYGSFCDFGGSSSRGWLLGWNQTSLVPLASKQLDDRLPSGSMFLSSIWMSGYGVAADATKNLYFLTGNTQNGTYGSSTNISESAVKISADLGAINSFFTPADVNGLDGHDTDYGSGGLMLLPNLPGQFPQVAVGAGKDGRMFVFDRSNLTGFHSTDVPEHVSIGDCWCGPSFFQSGSASQPVNQVVSSGGHTVMLWQTAVTSGATPKPTLTEVASADLNFNTNQDGGFFTSVSSYALQPKTAVIWAVGRAEGTDHHLTLYAYDGTPSGSSLPLLWSSPNPAGFWPNDGGNANIVPTVANGHVFVASNKQVQIFGLTLRPFPPRGPFPLPELMVAAPVPTGTQLWGTLTSVSGNRLTVRLRSGEEVQVDTTLAAQQGSVAELHSGMLVVMTGKMNADGSLQADSVARAKGQGSWGQDRKQ